MKNEKVNSLSVCMLIFALSKASFFGAGFHYVYENTHTSALFSVLLGIVLGLVIILVYLKLLSDKSLPLKIKEHFPKPISWFINTVLCVCAILYACLAFWRIVDFLVSQYLTNTPSLIIGILVIALVFYTLIKNLEVLTRFATITFIISGILILINILGLIPYVNLDNMKPLNFSLNPDFLKASFGFALLFAGPCFYITIFAKDNITDAKSFNKKFLIFYFISAVAIFLIFFFVLTCLGNEVIKLYTYPVYMVLKKIQFFNFIESIENITFFLWYIYLHILLLTCLFYVKNSIIELFKLKINTKNSVIISFILCIITLIIPFLVLEKNYSLSNKIYHEAPILINLVIVTISIICLIIFSIKKKRNSQLN